MGYTIITGATSDIGRQICKTMEAKGHYLLLTDQKREDLIETLNELQDPGKHIYLPLDLSEVEKAKAILQVFVLDNGIQISHAVFAAGIFAIKPLRAIDYAFVKKSFDIALFSIFAITQLLASKKVNKDSLKSIVIVSSISAIMGTKGYTVYSTVKAGMLGLTKSLAVELSPKTRVNLVMPGGIRTRTTQFLFEANVGFVNSRYLLGEGSSVDIANAVNFLISDSAKWMTGQQIIVDGGYTCC